MKTKTYYIIYFAILIMTLLWFISSTIYYHKNADITECFMFFCSYTIYHFPHGIEEYVCVPINIQDTDIPEIKISEESRGVILPD